MLLLVEGLHDFRGPLLMIGAFLLLTLSAELILWTCNLGGSDDEAPF